MKIRPKLGAECLQAAMQAAGDRLSRTDIDAAWKQLNDYRTYLESSSGRAAEEGEISAFARRQAENSLVEAARLRRQAALNILVRDKVEAAATAMMDAGLTPLQALLAILEGTQRGVAGARDSVASMRLGLEASYVGGIVSEIQANRPHVLHMLNDAKLDADIAIEMGEIKPGGRPGITGNPDAEFLAKTFHTYTELSRTELNGLGAAIGKLDGWFGPQAHDDLKMIAVGKPAWVKSVYDKLDFDRTFPDVFDRAEREEILSGIYDTIITGISDEPTAAGRGQRTGPANLARSLGKHRVLHFRDAQAALAYRSEFGYGSTITGILDHQRRAARLGAAMKVLGPNPEVMLASVMDSMERRIKANTRLSDAVKQKQLAKLRLDGGPLRQALDIATGLASRPVNVNMAQIGSTVRGLQSAAKLGGMLFSQTGDTISAGLASQFRGSGFFKGFFAQLDAIRRVTPDAESREIGYLLGEGFDGLLGQITHPSAAVDGPVGYLSGWQEKFYRWAGASWWTDNQRSAAGRMIAAEMGLRAKSAYGALPDAYRHVLGLHNIGEAEWTAIRQARFREVNGNFYITPDRIRDLPDAAIEPLVARRLQNVADADRRAKILRQGKRDLELKVLGYVADETTYGIIETDARSRRTSTQGLRPGTRPGELIRFMFQFKGFPLAFAQRVGGRALMGFQAGAGGAQAAHIGSLLVGMTMAGYAAMTLKDMARGYWPPRPIDDPKTWAAAFVQGGAAGIYGDFLFSRVNRFGGGLLETVAGPVPGMVGDIWDIYNNARDAALSGEEDMRYAQLLSFALENTPYVNLFYVRPALDYLFLQSLRELVSPGATSRAVSRRREDYGQERIDFGVPPLTRPLDPFGTGPS